MAGNTVYDIATDKKGFVWFGTSSGLVRFDGYNFKNFYHSPGKTQSLAGNFVRSLHVDQQGTLWVGTNKNGLNKFLNPGFEIFDSANQDLYSNKINAINSNSNGVLVGTEKGLNFITYSDNKVGIIKLLSKTITLNEKINGIFKVNSHEFIIGVNHSIVTLNTNTFDIKEHSIENNLELAAKTFAVDKKGNTWAGGQQGLFIKDAGSDTFKKKNLFDQTTGITDLLKTNSGIWLGTHGKGVYLLENDTPIRVVGDDPVLGNENTEYIFALHESDNEQLWIGTFREGVKNINLHGLNFNKFPTTPPLCKSNLNLSAIKPIQSDTFLVGSHSGIYLIDLHNSCIQVHRDNNQLERIDYIRSIQDFNTDEYLINSNNGVSLLNKKTKAFIDFPAPYMNTATNFVIKKFDGSFIQGTTKGLFNLDPKSREIVNLSKDSDFRDSFFSSFAILSNYTYLFGTTEGVAILKNGELKLFFQNEDFKSDSVNSIFVKKSIWVVYKSGKLFEYDFSGNRIGIYPLLQHDESLVANNITSLDSTPNDLWISTNKGLFNFKINEKKYYKYNKRNGLLDVSFNRGAFYADNNKDLLYFAGNNGITYFSPHQLKPISNTLEVVITKLTRFNKEVLINKDYDGLVINEPIENLKKLTLSHKDKIIGFEFSGLKSSDTRSPQYAYKLDGFHNDWNYTDAKNRIATFTNLNPGNYVFRVKATNKDGVWSKDEDNVALKIKVHPAPWFSWWAYTIYSILFLASLFSFIRYRTKAANLRAIRLEEEVKARTLEINEQKTTIENLLKRKDQLFANISHEFRTPLTLILGPLEKELKSLSEPKDPKTLQMIQRNAHRLVGMVEQILKLTELKNQEHKSKASYALDDVLLWVVESFQPLAQSKNIRLSLSSMSGASVLASPDALDVIFGNLISNAIKYTPNGGKVSIGAHRIDNHVSIYVRDNGVGMTENQQVEVFERFVRLDKTSDIAGSGIGLSIVKELVLSHAGDIRVQSDEEQGSTFTITLPITDIEPKFDGYATKAIEHLIQVNTLDDDQVKNQISDLNEIQQKPVVLIIDDNTDMRSYVSSVLDQEYQCITSERGAKGLELAEQYVPDIIICDVMMPEMDGYEVTRLLRSNIVTSHIPIILLTAKGDKQSRIQGWNENIDDYMTKPFDEVEVLARIQNLISLRKIISNRVADSIKHNNQTKDTSNEIGTNEKILNKKEQNFLDGFYKVIKDNFSDMYFQKNDFVKSMHISERQLHRKIKALTDKTPMELLKEYRLNKATEYLLDGETVTRTMELCGYNSASNFSRSFKAMYDVSPKQYQQTNQEN